jgi:hypothetical protein
MVPLTQYCTDFNAYTNTSIYNISHSDAFSSDSISFRNNYKTLDIPISGSIKPTTMVITPVNNQLTDTNLSVTSNYIGLQNISQNVTIQFLIKLNAIDISHLPASNDYDEGDLVFLY